MNKERELERVRGRQRDRQNTFGIKKKIIGLGGKAVGWWLYIYIYIYIYIKA
jgi:hypothetical protein